MIEFAQNLFSLSAISGHRNEGLRLSTSPKTIDSNLPNAAPPEYSNVSIVGLERDGLVLTARDALDEDGKRRTFIDLYDVRSMLFTRLYRHSSCVRVIGCSINGDRTLMALTTMSKLDSGSSSAPNHSRLGMDEQFESFIAELHPTGNWYPIGVKSPRVQRVQFLFYETEICRQSVKRASFYLFVSNDDVCFYAAQHQPRSDRGVRLTEHGNQLAVLAKQIIWCQWCSQRNLLYVVLSRSGKKELATDLVLKCFTFPDRRTILMGYAEKEHRLKWEILLGPQLKIGSSQIDPLFLYPFSSLTSVPCFQQLSVVHLRRAGICLCQQLQIADPVYIQDLNDHCSADVSIFVLHKRAKVDISIPLFNLSPRCAQAVRVFFDSIGDMLLVYIPGIFLQLVDCGEDHGPVMNLTLFGPGFAPLLPSVFGQSLEETPRASVSADDILGMEFVYSNSDDVPLLCSLDPLTASDAQTSEIDGHMMLDCKTGTIYRYKICRNSIIHLFDEYVNVAVLVRALHLSLVHLNDADFVQQIMRHLFTKSSFNLSTKLLAEYLIGSSYLEAIRKIRPPLDFPFELVLPLSLIKSSAKHSNIHLNITVRFSELKGYTSLPGVKSLMKEREDLRRFSLKHSLPSRVSAFAPLAALPTSPVVAPAPGIKRFVTDLFGLEDDSKFKPIIEDRPSQAEEQPQAGLFTHLMQFCKDKFACMYVTREYAKVQQLQVDMLFQILMESSECNSEQMTFQALECLYCALEEFGFPFPTGFASTYVLLAFKCLPRSMFLSYVERSIVSVSEDFCLYVSETLEGSENPEDWDFYYYLVCQCVEQQSKVLLQPQQQHQLAFSLLKPHKENAQYPC
eukprot:TRINITY_DN18836_c0_g1_i1.p1 TRINITY_DN18836_c0_g1~~TRINITY_DN18836_c0_g1_i1.p1  ORF type:complete len:848 (-),score=-81.58 TRINITY_DN18836_c0_g1_i1:81-2624(-)